MRKMRHREVKSFVQDYENKVVEPEFEPVWFKVCLTYEKTNTHQRGMLNCKVLMPTFLASDSTFKLFDKLRICVTNW